METGKNSGKSSLKPLAYLAASLLFACPAYAGKTGQKPQKEHDEHYVYAVQPGDTLTKVARKYNLKLEQILEANKQIENPDLINEGQKITIPGFIVYSVQKGDTIYRIGRKFNVSGKDIIKMNSIENPDCIQPEQKMIIPLHQDSSDLEKNIANPKPAEKEPAVKADSTYDLLKSYIGIPYGPKYPRGADKDKKHLDCVSLVYDFAEKKGIKLTGSRGDEIYSRHTTHIAELTPEKKDLAGIQTGDIVFICHPYKFGEGGISAYHLAIIGKPVYDDKGKIVDYTMIHASGGYGKDRVTDYHGKVVEENLLGYLERFKDNSRRNHMFIGRLKKD